MGRTIAESELLYEKVKRHFWQADEAEFVVSFSSVPMEEWVKTPTYGDEDMALKRVRLWDNFAGFVYEEGRYSFYFVDSNIAKFQFMDNGEISYFDVHSSSEIDPRRIREELKALLQGS